MLVMLSARPNFDTVAAGLSLYLSLHDSKEATISCPSQMMVGFNRLIGINKITSELGNKNLTIRFKGYDATGIDKVSYDIENGEFKLTVVPKSGILAPQSEQVNLSYSGISADLVILVGGSTEADFPILGSEQIANAKVVHIGYRSLSTNHEVMSLAKPGSSNSELVTVLIKENGLSMDADVATNLVAGIEEGSRNFTSNEVTPETFEIFAHLMRSGGKRLPRVKLNPSNFPPGSIPTRPFVKQQMPQRPPKVIPAQQIPEERDAQDIEGTQESEADINPPDDWLQPKVFKGGSPGQNMPTSFSENKG